MKPTLEPTRSPFEGVDLREAGRRGGHASGVSRRLREQRELEAGIIQSRNGAAKAKLLEQKRRDQAELLERQLEADRMVSELDTEAENLRATIKDLGAECDALRAERATLEKELKRGRDSDDALVEYLRDVGEQRVQRACIARGWIEDEASDAVA